MFARNHLRRLAAYVLLGWVFALATGIVNACVIQPSLRAADTASRVHEADASTRSIDAHWTHDHGEGQPGPSQEHKAPCDKFCDEPSTVAQTPKQTFDPIDLGWLVLPPSSDAPTDATRIASGIATGHPERWRPAAPIPILFLRLTL